MPAEAERALALREDRAVSSSGLNEVLAKARATLVSGKLTTEAAVQASVIRPILRELGWDDADPQQWQVEYQVDNGRVDEALLGPLGKPLVFVEAKRPGVLNPKAEDQLFRYANNRGVPLLVLTDGDTWDLYLSMAEGEPSERRFAHLTLTESDDLGRVAQDLREFLARDAVLSGRGDDAAKARLKQVKDREIGKGGLKSAWVELLREPDDILRDLLVERVEQDVGSRPWVRDAEAFLRRQRTSQPSTTSKPDLTNPEHWLAAAPSTLSAQQRGQIRQWLASSGLPGKPEPSKKPTGSQKLRGFVLDGVEHRAGTAAAAVRQLALALQERDVQFLTRWAAFNPSGKIKRPRAVQVGHPVLQTADRRYYRELKEHPGWWFFSHGSNQTMIRRLKNMTLVAGLSWNGDVSPILE